MTDDDIRKPLAWIYDGTKPDSHIAGLFYMTSNADPAGFAGSNDTWHVHHDICIKPAPNGDDRRAARRRPRRDQGAVRRGRRQPAEADAVPAARVGGARVREPRRCVLAPQLRGHVRRRQLQDDRRHQDRRVDDDLRRRHRVTRRAYVARMATEAAVSARRVPPRVHGDGDEGRRAIASRSTGPRSIRPAAASRTTPARSTGASVTDVRKDGDDVWHTLDGAVPAVGRRGRRRGRLGTPPPADAHAHGAARAVRRHLERVGQGGDRRQHGAARGAHGLRVRPVARRLRGRASRIS